jgi:hypothetical protein
VVEEGDAIVPIPISSVFGRRITGGEKEMKKTLWAVPMILVALFSYSAGPVEFKVTVHTPAVQQVLRVLAHYCVVTGKDEQLGRDTIRCQVLFKNEAEQGIAALGLRWEGLDGTGKLVELQGSIADFAHPKGKRGPAGLKRSEVYEETKQFWPAPEVSVATVHAHTVFVQLEDGTVLPPGGKSSADYQEFLRGRSEAGPAGGRTIEEKKEK